MFEIEKAIPVPTKSKYPFEQMGIGDSFYVKGGKKAIASARVAAKTYSDKSANGSDQPVFITRTDDYGVRIWRIK
jgi:hypothetical protein